MAKAIVTCRRDLLEAHQVKRCENQKRLSIPGWENSMSYLTLQSWRWGVHTGSLASHLPWGRKTRKKMILCESVKNRLVTL